MTSEVDERAVQEWANRYVEGERNVSRGINRRQKGYQEIRKDLHAAFPLLSLIQLAIWAWRIYWLLRRTDQKTKTD